MDLKDHNNRDKLPFEQLYQDHRAELVKFALHYTGNLEQSQDIVQEVFLTLLDRDETLEIHSSFKAYLYASVKNRCLNLLRNLKIRDTHRLIEIEALWDQILADEIRDDSLIREVLDAIEKLPPELGELFALKHLEMKKISEISREKNLNENTIKKRLMKAREILRNKLAHLNTLILNLFF